MIILMALFFGAGSSALISITFQASLDQEKNAAQESYCMILNTLQVVNRKNGYFKNPGPTFRAKCFLVGASATF